MERQEKFWQDVLRAARWSAAAVTSLLVLLAIFTPASLSRLLPDFFLGLGVPLACFALAESLARGIVSGQKETGLVYLALGAVLYSTTGHRALALLLMAASALLQFFSLREKNAKPNSQN